MFSLGEPFNVRVLACTGCYDGANFHEIDFFTVCGKILAPGITSLSVQLKGWK